MGKSSSRLLNDALEELASLFEYGHLQADTLPVDFLKRVSTEIKELRVGLETAEHDCDQYDARRRESIAKYEELRLEHQKLKQEVDAFKALIGYEKGDGDERWKEARGRAFAYAQKRGKL